MTVTTPVFEAQFKLIQERGYKVIPLAALVAALGDSAAPLPERAVVLTADDGHRTVYSDMFPSNRTPSGIPISTSRRSA